MVLPWINLEKGDFTSLCTFGFWLCFSADRSEGRRWTVAGGALSVLAVLLGSHM